MNVWWDPMNVKNSYQCLFPPRRAHSALAPHTSLFALAPPSLLLHRHHVESPLSLPLRHRHQMPPPLPVARCADTRGHLHRVILLLPNTTTARHHPRCRGASGPTLSPSQPTSADATPKPVSPTTNASRWVSSPRRPLPAAL
jgi:hypothetical protein